MATGVLAKIGRRALLLLSLALGLPAQAEPDPHLVRIGTGEWSPYVEQSRADAGAIGRLISAVFARAGYRVEYFFYPWARDVYLLQHAQVDAIMPYVCSAERATFSLCSEPLVHTEMAFFHRRDKPFEWRRVEDLSTYEIAISKGYYYTAAFEAERQAGRLHLQENTSEERGMRLLLSKRADLYLQDRAVGNALLKRVFSVEEQQLLTSHPRTVGREMVGLLFTQDARGEQLRAAFNTGVQLLRDSGQLQQLQEALNNGDASQWQVHF